MRLPTIEALAGKPLRTSPTIWLIALSVGAWLFLGTQGVDLLSPDATDLTAWGGNLGPRTLGGEWWRLLTSMFLHGGPVHLLLNMFLLFEIGLLSEAVWGRMRFALVYIVSGLYGSLASAWWHTRDLAQGMSVTVSVGASGAVLGTAAALLLCAWRANDEGAIDIKNIFQLVSLNIGLGFLMPGVDNAAHVGGALAGAIVSGILFKSGRSTRARPVQLAAVFGASLLALAVLGHLAIVG